MFKLKTILLQEGPGNDILSTYTKLTSRLGPQLDRLDKEITRMKHTRDMYEQAIKTTFPKFIKMLISKNLISDMEKRTINKDRIAFDFTYDDNNKNVIDKMAKQLSVQDNELKIWHHKPNEFTAIMGID